ncbi:alpha/beta hydrolase [Salipiger abyssi]|uniref:alpha/beta hydrolase n=1 Tax=Salipiger abyssi TaxID=1250539 RepID=UPI004059DD35
MMGRRNFLAGLAAIGTGGPTLAQPMQAVAEPTVLETGSVHYNTAELRLPHPVPGLADHRIRIAWPRGPVPEGGFPALHMLDGRAVAALLDEPLLARLAARGGPAIVAHGHARATRFATLERAQDYTPPDAEGRPVADPRGRAGGGALDYLALLTGEILPRVETRAPLDPARRLLWGHSYGGLFVLQAALAAGGAFARFVAASPALWWDDARFYARVLAIIVEGLSPMPVLDLHSGSAERTRASRPSNPDAQDLLRMRDALPAGALDRLSEALRGHGVPGETLVFDGLSHGESFASSARTTLLETALEL